MGITDDEYAKAVDRRSREYLEAVQQRHDLKQQPIGLKPLRLEDLKHEAMQAPLSSLSDMWTVRWGSDWVEEQEFMDDDFWRLTLTRLIAANKLEKHNLVNQYHCVYRIIE